MTCTVLTPDGTEAEADVIENEDGTYDIFYTAAKPGTYMSLALVASIFPTVPSLSW